MPNSPHWRNGTVSHQYISRGQSNIHPALPDQNWFYNERLVQTGEAMDAGDYFGLRLTGFEEDRFYWLRGAHIAASFVVANSNPDLAVRLFTFPALIWGIRNPDADAKDSDDMIAEEMVALGGPNIGPPWQYSSSSDGSPFLICGPFTEYYYDNFAYTMVANLPSGFHPIFGPNIVDSSTRYTAACWLHFQNKGAMVSDASWRFSAGVWGHSWPRTSLQTGAPIDYINGIYPFDPTFRRP